MTDDKDAPVAKFKVGDRVRTRQHLIVQHQFAGDKAEEFTVTAVHVGFPGNTKLGNFYYSGDKEHSGVWENNLELVRSAEWVIPAPRFSVGDKVRVKYGKHLQSALSGEVFTITRVSDYYLYSVEPEEHDYWYEGDISRYGIWERNLEPVLNLVPDPEVEEALAAIVEPSEDLTNYHYLVVEALKAQVDIMDELMTAIRAELLSANDASQKTVATYKLGILHQVRREQMSYERLIVNVENMYNDMVVLEGNY